MTEILEYAPCMWYCPNCGGLVKGFRGKNSTVKAECNVCRTVMVWK